MVDQIEWEVVAAQLGDRSAMDNLLRRVQGDLFQHLAYLLGSDENAADALQDTLVTISRKLGALREPRWFRAWAFRIATRIAFRQSRRSRNGPALVAVDDAPELSASEPDPRPFDEVDLAWIRETIPHVPPASQLILRMHYGSGLTHAEIAEALDLSIGTVKSRHNYGLRWLRERVPRQR